MHFLEIKSKVKNHHISEAGVSFEIQFGLCIKIWAGKHIFYIWQQTIALRREIQDECPLVSKSISFQDSLFLTV